MIEAEGAFTVFAMIIVVIAFACSRKPRASVPPDLARVNTLAAERLRTLPDVEDEPEEDYGDEFGLTAAEWDACIPVPEDAPTEPIAVPLPEPEVAPVPKPAKVRKPKALRSVPVAPAAPITPSVPEPAPERAPTVKAVRPPAAPVSRAPAKVARRKRDSSTFDPAPVKARKGCPTHPFGSGYCSACASVNAA